MSESMDLETRVKILDEENEKLKAALADVCKIHFFKIYEFLI